MYSGLNQTAQQPMVQHVTSWLWLEKTPKTACSLLRFPPKDMWEHQAEPAQRKDPALVQLPGLCPLTRCWDAAGPAAPDPRAQGKKLTGDADTPAAERGCERAAGDPVREPPWEFWKNKKGHGGVQALDTDTMSMATESNHAQLKSPLALEASRSSSPYCWAPAVKNQGLATVCQGQGGSSISSGTGKRCKERGMRRGRDMFKAAHYGPSGWAALPGANDACSPLAVAQPRAWFHQGMGEGGHCFVVTQKHP